MSNKNAEEAKVNLNGGTQTVEQEILRRRIVVYVIDAARGSQTLKKLCELGLIIVIIIARWCMPRGDITKDQLSALLLVYVGNSADILELFDLFEEPEVIGNKPVIIATMSLFTWSMYQFALITTATVKGEEISEHDRTPKHPYNNVRMTRVSPADVHSGNDFKRNKELVENYIGSIRNKNRKVSSTHKPYESFNRGRGKKISTITAGGVRTPINESATNDKKQKIKQREMHGELYQILVTLLMQDGPFLMLRLYLLIELNVSSEMHIFFTCKNAIVSLLQIYRLLILSCHGRDEVDDDLDREDASTKLHNIQVAMELNQIRDIKLADVSVK